MSRQRRKGNRKNAVTNRPTLKQTTAVVVASATHRERQVFMRLNGRPERNSDLKSYDLAVFMPGGRLMSSNSWNERGHNTGTLEQFHCQLVRMLGDTISGAFDATKPDPEYIYDAISKCKQRIFADMAKTVASLIRKTYPDSKFPTKLIPLLPRTSQSQGDDSDDEEDADARDNPSEFWPFDPCLRLEKFMIGKTSGERTRTFKNSVKGRFNLKYYSQDYTHICMLAMLDACLLGIDGTTAENVALELESALFSVFGKHGAFDSNLSNQSSGRVAKINVDNSWYGVYIALKLKP